MNNQIPALICQSLDKLFETGLICKKWAVQQRIHFLKIHGFVSLPETYSI